jgi:hypothetical protein
MNRPAGYVSVPLVRSLNATNRSVGSLPTSLNAAIFKGWFLSVNSSEPTRRIFRFVPVEVGISMIVRSSIGFSEAGTL